MLNALDMVIGNFVSQFNSRVLTRASAQTFSAVLDVVNSETEVIFKMKRDETQHVICIPKPYVRDNVVLVSINDIERSVSKYYWKLHNRVMNYCDVIYEVLFGFPVHILPESMLKSNTSVMQQLRYAYENNKLAVTTRSIQKKINHIVNNLPMHETNMNSFIMNHRITIFDLEFDVLTNPEEQHAYQVKKNKEFFDTGWSSLGLSDGCLANKNYMLDYDLRKLTPFGSNFHNPQRNLYSTLGMKGDETPLVHSEETFRLAQNGLTRKGWNLFTIFVDVPDVWEDQLMVDIRHSNKYIEYTKKCMCHGKALVKVGDILYTNDPLYVNNSKEVKSFDVQCDSAVVEKIEEKENNIGGALFPVLLITVKYKRYLKDGTKLTNLAANKGVIRMRDLGYAINPVTGKQQKIDVIVSAKAVLKRKNYTQVLEALLNNINDNNVVVIPENLVITEEAISSALVSSGHNADGTWSCHTYSGDFRCVAGNVFWGVTHDADDTVWRSGATHVENGRGLREAGLKFSTIEFRALATRFGRDNALEKEILSYAQGYADVKELLSILNCQLGKKDLAYTTKNIFDIAPLNQEAGIMLMEEELVGSIVDPNMEDNGFMLKLPVKYQIVLDRKSNILTCGFPVKVEEKVGNKAVGKVIIIDSLYVPYANLRKCWKHDIGKVGLNDIGNALNTIVVMSHSYLKENSNITLSMLYSAISTYFYTVSSKLSTKNGELSVHTMAVRYPHSVKGVATLSNTLPRNTVRIHSVMASELKLVEGDIVLVERFPCLGFMSLRPQKVMITDDPLCRFSIQVSGNSLGSMSLDFDGDVIYLAAFYSEASKNALKKELNTPNEHCIKYIEAFNSKMGVPRLMEMSLQDYKIAPFDKLTSDTHAEIVSKLTGVKSNTGPVVALAYNLLRIMENSELAGNQEIESGIEVFIDTVANSVFKQKHGVKSLHKIVMDAVCSADLETLVSEGFDQKISEIICSKIREKAAQIGIKDVKQYHKLITEEGGSNVINRLVREQNILYFTSRANLDSCKIVKNVADFAVVDIPSSIFTKIMSLNSAFEKSDLADLNSLKNPEAFHYYTGALKELNRIINTEKSI